MKAMTWLVASAFTACLHLAAPRAARALIEPSRAQADADAARREKSFTFCSEPHRPLSHRALGLCAGAKDIPSCEGFAAACEDARAPRLRWFSLSPEAMLTIGRVVRALAWLVVASLVTALLVPILRAIGRPRRSRNLADAQESPAAPADDAGTSGADVLAMTDEDVLLERAALHARRGEHAIALQLFLAASLRALDKRGAVKMAKDRTNGEYVRSCTDPEAKTALREIVRDVDRVRFGHEEATREAADRAAGRAAAIVRGVRSAAIVVATLTLAGCGPGVVPGRHAGDDPAGHELLIELLRRQDVRAQPLEGSLASLPLPEPGERAPAVLVDAEQTEMDDETRAHVMEWVDAGGSLVLAGAPETWPDDLGVVAAEAYGPGKVSVRRLLGRARVESASDDVTAPERTEPVVATAIEHGEVGARVALTIKGRIESVAWFDDDLVYAASVPHGKGWVLAIATGELMTNAGLARPGNASASLAILSNADRLDFKIAQPEDGVAPPTTPITAMTRAGLGLGMVHALAAALVLFLAVGTRMARATPSPAPARRAFVEHVEAMGALYARTGSAEHALAAYARFAHERLRSKMPRGTSDVAGFLSSRARLPLDVCERVWRRATSPDAAPGDPADALATLKELSAVYTAATAKDV